MRIPSPYWLLALGVAAPCAAAQAADAFAPAGAKATLSVEYLYESAGKKQDKPFTVALKGGWRSQSGEQVTGQRGRRQTHGALALSGIVTGDWHQRKKLNMPCSGRAGARG